MKFEETITQREWENGRDIPFGADISGADADDAPSDAALGALLDDGESDDDDAERRVRRLGARLARLDALNVGGMLAAATDAGGAGAALGGRLGAALDAAEALGGRRARLAELLRAAPAAPHARSDAARADANARLLLAQLARLFAWLDAPALDWPADAALSSAEGRARALAAGEALRDALRASAAAPPALLRLAAVQERLRRLARARDQLAGALARHLNNALIHLGNEAAHEPRARHHAELLPLAPFMRWLKLMDERAFDALAKVYVGTWARVYERELRAAMDAAKAALQAAPAAEEPLDRALAAAEDLCNAEQDFCARFFFLDVDVKAESGDGDRSERSSGGESGRAPRAGPESRRFMAELFPSLEADLVALVAHVEKLDPYGAMRALACVGRRVLGDAGSEARWARAALASAAVAAKRGADRAVAERVAALPDAVRAAARRPKCGILAFVPELEAMAAACEPAFAASGRRADLERWYLSLASAMLRAIQHAEHPRTPRAVLHMENFHRLHGAVMSLRAGAALDALRRDCRARYADALRAYVTQCFGRPLEKLTQFFEGVAEAVAQGVREDEVCYRAAFSKHELRRVLALYPAPEVRKSLHRLYRTVEKQLSEEGGLLQVVWRALQEEFIAQHVALQARIAACYPGTGLALPLTTQHILDAFSDIAREH